MTPTEKRILYTLSLATSLAFTSDWIVRPLVPQLSQDLGQAGIILGAIISLYSFLPLIMAIPAGTMTDRIGTRPLMLLGSGGMTTSALLLTHSPTVPFIAAAQVIAGMGQFLVVLAAQTRVSSNAAPGHEETSFGVYTSLIAAGQLAGPFLGGLIKDYFGYTAAFSAAAAINLVSFALLFTVPDKPSAHRQASFAGDLREVPRLLHNTGIRAAILTSFIVLFAAGVRQSFYPAYLQVLGYRSTTIGIFISVRALTAIAIRPFMSRVIGLIGDRHRTIVYATIITGLGIGHVPILSSPFWLIAGSVLVGLGTGLTQPLSILAVAQNSPEQERGLAMAVRLTGNRLAQFANPLIYGFIAGGFGMPAAFLAGGAILLAAAYLLYSLKDAFPELAREKAC